MTWTKLSDDYNDETYGLSNGAYRVHTNALVLSNKYLLDGVLTPREINKIEVQGETPVKVFIDELLEKGFWQRVGNSYALVFGQADQPTREAELRRREANRKNGAKGGRPKGVSSQTWAEKSAQGNNEKTHSVKNPVGYETHLQSHSQSDSVSHSQSHSVLKTHSLTQMDGSGYEEVIEPTENYQTWQTVKPGTMCAHCRRRPYDGNDNLCSECRFGNDIAA